jgi:hypothetical protein
LPGRMTFVCATAMCATALLLGCTAAPHPSPPDPGTSDAVASCRVLFEVLDDAVSSAGVGDAQATRVPGLPYLRINRLLAHGVDVPADGAAFDAWISQLRNLDRRARRAELANLGAAAAVTEAELEQCARRLIRHDLADPMTRQRLLQYPVPDDYRLSHRILGLYPLAAQPFLLGVQRLHRETHTTFTTPLEQLPVQGQLQRFIPDVASTPSDSVTPVPAPHQAGGHRLGIPEPAPEVMAQLWIEHAPIWEIDTASVADRPGQPRLTPKGRPWVGGAPVVYTLPSYARWQGEILLQLNYVLWFPRRPRTGPFDLVGGHLDGITWRVTLDRAGRTLIYDSMHNCGCYYKAFPTPRAHLLRQRQGWEEPIMVPQSVPDGPGRIVLRVSSGSHYIQRVYRGGDDEVANAEDPRHYILDDYDALRSLPIPEGGRRSLFRADAIVPGTERPERWLFWPMGVPEPGAMRQWGRHAIAFVGRRHFDDPHLLERYFEPYQTDQARR